MNELLVIGATAALLLVLLALYGVVAGLEHLSPAFSRWLDRTVGPQR